MSDHRPTSKDEDLDIRERLAAQEAQIQLLLEQSGKPKTYPPGHWSLNLSDDDDGDHLDQNQESERFVAQFNKDDNTSAGLPDGDNNEDYLHELLKDVEGTIEYGPDVMAQIAEGFVKTVIRPLSKESASNIKDKFKVPGNCKQFNVPKINPEIWNHLPPQSKMTDIKYQQIQQTLSQGLVGLARIAQEVASRDQLQNISGRRKTEVKKFINPEYNAICSLQAAGSEYLFGNDLNESLKASKAVSNVVRKSMSIQPNRYRPYTYQRTPQQSLNFRRPFSQSYPRRGNPGPYRGGRFELRPSQPYQQYVRHQK
ncbi:hypothetical protein Fcan01_25142 [Folsomia candida]|uniref:Uncharacterized protein n=1 Tax=Folsomia candida TaxID=158441 RepID=A0A226D708_FOLCA|nr:hypothetical protein Fcan01_25142 [Folsomia candida]